MNSVNTGNRPGHRAIGLALPIFMVAFMALLSGCDRPAPDLPTLAVLPSSTNTYTFTPSFTPSNTFTPTPTLTPSDTFTPTPTSTPTPTFTPTFTLTPTPTITPSDTPTLTPSNTFTPTPTPTDTPTFTPTPTDTPTPTFTRTPRPTRTPTLAPPRIVLFTVEPALTVPSGSQVVVRWSADAESVTLEQLSGQERLIQIAPVPNEGQQTYTLTTDLGKVSIFRLTATRGGRQAQQRIAVNIACAVVWFFIPAPGDFCPESPAQFFPAVYQVFERGLAIYIPTTNLVYILALEGQRVAAYQNVWREGIVFPVPVPPAGRLVPTQQIGYAWATYRWIDGRPIQDVLGFAVSAPESYQATTQAGRTPAELYVSEPNGNVLLMVLTGTSGWARVGRAN